MLPFLNKKLAQFMERQLHKKRDKYINDTIVLYRKKHPEHSEEIINKLKESLELEIERVFAIADSSIISARIVVASWVFWITAIVGTAIVLGVASYPVTTSLAPFFVPLISATVVWAVTIATVPKYYNERIVGGLDSALVVFESKLTEELAKEENRINANELAELRKMMMEMKQELDELRRGRSFPREALHDAWPEEVSRVYLGSPTLFQPEPEKAEIPSPEAVPSRKFSS